MSRRRHLRPAVVSAVVSAVAVAVTALVGTAAPVGAADLAGAAPTVRSAPARAVPATVSAAVPATSSAARPAVVADDSALAARISTLMQDPSMTAPTTTKGLRVVDATTGGVVWTGGSTVPLAPASTLKLFTAAAGMAILGSGYRWPTEVWTWPMRTGGVVPGNLYLKGYGDPTLLESDLAAMAASLKAKGVTRIAGSIMADTTFFDDQRYNPTWSSSYLSQYYAAQISALSLSPDTDYDAGTIIVTYSPGAGSGSAVRYTVTPAGAAPYVRIVNNARTSASGTSSTFTATRANGTNTITLGGQVPLGRAAAKQWVTVNDPGAYAASVLRLQLQKVGIRVDGGYGRMTKTAGTVLYSRTSSRLTLGQLLTPFLKLSNNGHAEVITKTIGSRYGRPGNWADGTAAISRYASGLGVSMTGSRLADGSGLSTSDRLTPYQLVTLLQKLKAQSWFPTLRAALPIAGTDPMRWNGGTLTDRMRGTPAAGNLRAKTGTLYGYVTALAGYVSGADGRGYIFAIISNYSGTSPRPVEDRIGALLAGWRVPR